MSSIAEELDVLRGFASSAELPAIHGPAVVTGVYRQQPEDFFVSETALEPCGEGEHLYLRIRKTGQNTRWVAKELAHQLHIPFRAVSYAGLKDRHAVTEQWFAVHLPGQPYPDFAELNIEGVEIIRSGRHSKKLRQGQLSYNSFRLLIRDCHYSSAESLDERLQIISQQGVPNYFGPQRFGFQLGNLDVPESLDNLAVLPRERRSFVISALRSALFNGYLASRVIDNSWEAPLSGEVTISDRSRGVAEEDESVFSAIRLPAGILWGGGVVFKDDEAGRYERDYFSRFPLLCKLLEASGARASRRVLKLRVANMLWQLQDKQLQLEFSLGPGCFATALLHELGELHDQGSLDA